MKTKRTTENPLSAARSALVNVDSAEFYAAALRSNAPPAALHATCNVLLALQPEAMRRIDALVAERNAQLHLRTDGQANTVADIARARVIAKKQGVAEANRWLRERRAMSAAMRRSPLLTRSALVRQLVELGLQAYAQACKAGAAPAVPRSRRGGLRPGTEK